MKKIIRKLAAVVMIATMVAPVFAQDLRLKQNSTPAYDKMNQQAGYDLVDGQAAGTRTVYDIIVKEGTTFVNAEEFAQAMDLYLHEEDWGIKNNEITYILTNKILHSDRIPGEFYNIELSFEVAEKEFVLSAIEPTQIMIDGEYYDTTKATFENHYLPLKIYFNPDEDSNRKGTFTMTPFKKDGKIYVPLKPLVQALNNDQNTKITYNSATKSVTFQKDFMYKHYLFNGTITDNNYYNWNAK